MGKNISNKILFVGHKRPSHFPSYQNLEEIQHGALQDSKLRSGSTTVLYNTNAKQIPERAEFIVSNLSELKRFPGTGSTCWVLLG